ncbi:Z1 domain-containing protein [Kistimonas asteriae]|uniref:Z1 domain-containing protein n=1 Tax=Kistimonas asteriae TaxID=517724 RepID=UPI001BA4F19F|nr:Z1 domain-containing protein [Kistimonas asteriae]
MNTNGKYYNHFLESAQFPYTKEEQTCIENTVLKLKSIDTYGSHPGMLLGKIQSGKTKTFMAIIGLAFDNGYEISVVLTKGTKALATQTQLRIKNDFKPFINDDCIEIYDIMNMPEKLTKWELKKKIVIIVKKQKDNLSRLQTLFSDEKYQVFSKKTLIVDDEADYASVGYNKKDGELTPNLTAIELDKLRKIAKDVSFLQVTATPYALYLQPKDIEIDGVLFKPVRPSFTELVPVNEAYVGSDFYFDDSADENSTAFYLHHKLTEKELLALKKKDRRKINLDDTLNSNAIPGLRMAVSNFIIGAAIRQLQCEHNDLPPRKFSFLIHTETAKSAHSWQKEIVDALHDSLIEESCKDSDLFTNIVTTSYLDIKKSVLLNNDYLPPIDDVKKRVKEILEDEQLLVANVNSEQQVESMLDDSGQLKLRAPLNTFIGGQILDRGITIGNLIGFFYGRKPKNFQQDTVLQHCRMFGYRPHEDLAVTRFYTEQSIYTSMRKMHESDIALREQFSKVPDQGVAFIQGSTNGIVRPCSPNKIMLSKTTTLKPYKRIIPVGFQTKNKTITKNITKKIDRLLEQAHPKGPQKEPFEIKTEIALQIIDLASEAIVMSEDEGYTFDWNGLKNAIKYMVNNSTTPEVMQCMWLTGRKNNRLAGEGSHTKYVATPDTAKTEGRQARKHGKSSPVLALFRQIGSEELNWRGAEFYWPLVYAAGDIPITIYADETHNYDI